MLNYLYKGSRPYIAYVVQNLPDFDSTLGRAMLIPSSI